MASITLEHVEKRFASGHAGVRDVSLQIAHGELIVLVGPSGSGKSTTLRLIAGLETPTAGRILVGDRDVTMVPPNERDLAMVFQSYALYPHKTVRENLAFGLRMRGVDRRAIDARVGEVADSLQITELLDRRPAQLSGGQRQRVAVGRAIVREPQAFLFDEPLSNLDPALRLDTRAELALLHRRLGATIVYVTHDQEEAMTLGQRIVVMRDGAVEQVAPPLELYRRPQTLFVARFIGSPPMNIVDAIVKGGRLQAPGLAREPLPLAEAGSAAEGKAVKLGVRPHDLEIVPDSIEGHAADVDVLARVTLVEPLGRELHVHVRTEPENVPLTVVASSDTVIAPEDRIGLRLRRDRLHLFDPPSGARIDIRSSELPVAGSA
jgi:multiple sugar transport system ATP-binding protein